MLGSIFWTSGGRSGDSFHKISVKIIYLLLPCFFFIDLLVTRMLTVTYMHMKPSQTQLTFSSRDLSFHKVPASAYQLFHHLSLIHR